MGAEYVLEQFEMGEASIGRNVSSVARIHAMVCFAVVFVAQTAAAKATQNIISHRSAQHARRSIFGYMSVDPLGDAAKNMVRCYAALVVVGQLFFV